jgi:hypothetical protein
MSLRALIFIVFVGLASQALAHDSRPNFIEIIETDPGLFSVQWKVPASVPNAALPTIGMPESCTTGSVRAIYQYQLPDPQSVAVDPLPGAACQWRAACSRTQAR